jgi:glycosyltransferase involved in cell wall biosynthesis
MPLSSTHSRLKRIDLHCHSDASTKTSEALLNAIRCPDSYSRPTEVYDQAKSRGMDFVTLTDHDTIDGATTIASRADVLVGEELSCWFPEDQCKMHVLVWGIDAQQHAELQLRAKNIYDVAEYIERQRIAHAVAHPIYRQNDKLERWHLERLLLMFKGFECLNGAHSPLHREAFEPVLNRLTKQEIQRLSETHGLLPRWHEPWIKARTAGSDDHGLLNVGRTWTEFAENVTTTQQLLQALRDGQCQPGGEAGSSAKLAHTFYSVAVRYYSRHIMSPDAKPNLATALLQTLAGERRAPGKRELAKYALKHKLKKISSKVTRPFRAKKKSDDGSGIIKRLFLESARKRITEDPELYKIAEKGLPPLGEHERMFEFISKINRDVVQGVAKSIDDSIDRASFVGLFDSIGAALAQQFVLLPYYFTVFHQNKERHLLRQITGQRHLHDGDKLHVGLFTDTFDDVNGVSRFVHDMAGEASRAGRRLTIHTCCDGDVDGSNLARRNFHPLLSRPFPFYEQLRLNLPPVLEILEWADRQQFDAIHVSTPGPMGLCGWLVSKMLRVPMLATYHTDFPAYVDQLCGDHRVTNGTITYLKWFYDQAAIVFSRSASYRFKIGDLGIPENRMRVIPPGINLERFNPSFRDESCWARHGVKEQFKLLYSGRVSVEKNPQLLVDCFKQLCATRKDTALVITGDGPHLAAMKESLRGYPAYFLGHQTGDALSTLYASADLLVFPSRTDTLGQAVMEAQASGLPAIVSNEGGPKETVDDGHTGLVIPSTDPATWSAAIDHLLDDEPRRTRMSRAAVERMSRFSLQATFESFWNDHALAAEPEIDTPPLPASKDLLSL